MSEYTDYLIDRNSDSMRTDKPKKPTTGINAIKGVTNFIVGKGFHEDDMDLIAAIYCRKEGMNDTTREERCNYIQLDFGKFVRWFRAEYPKKS